MKDFSHSEEFFVSYKLANRQKIGILVMKKNNCLSIFICMKKEKMKKKSLIFFWILCGMVLTGCGAREDMSVEDYNNLIIGYQTRAVESVEQYFSNLDQDYDGQNLPMLYVGIRGKLAQLQSQAAEQEAWKRDERLRDGVVAYISGLQMVLEQYEKPVIELLGAYTGEARDLYRRDKELITSFTMKFAAELAILDKEMDRVQAQFAQKYGYQVQ